MSESAVRGAGGRAVAAARSNLLLFPVTAVVALASTVVVARTLPFGEFALYAIALAFRGTIQFLADLGTGSASSRAFAQMQAAGARAQAKRLYGRLLSLRVAAVLLLVLVVALTPDTLAGGLDLAPDERDLVWFAAIIGGPEILGGLGYYALNGMFGHPVVNRITLAQGLTQPALVIAASAGGLGLTGILAAVACGSLMRAVLLHAGALRGIHRIQETGARVENVAREYSGVAAGTLAGKAAAWAHSRQAVTLLVAAASTRRELAVFSLAYDFAHSTMAAAMGPATGLALPSFAIQETDAARRELFRTGARLLAFLTFPAAALLVALAPALVPVLFGERYEDAVAYLFVILPLLAAELALSTPATGLMTVQTRLLKAYSAIKLATLASVAVYLVIGEGDLLVIAAVMLGVRLLSTLALHAVIGLRERVTVEYGRLAALAASCAAAAAAAALVRDTLGDGAPGLAAGTLCFVVVAATLVRSARIVPAADAALAVRILPAARPLIRLVSR